MSSYFKGLNASSSEFKRGVNVLGYVGPIKIDRLTRFYKKISLQEYPYFDIALMKLQYIYAK